MLQALIIFFQPVSCLFPHIFQNTLPAYNLLFPLTTALPLPQFISCYWGSEQISVYPEGTAEMF